MLNKFNNICFIGMPYAGKSYLGNKLYPIINKGFIDTDNIIKYTYGHDLHILINKLGNENFLNMESKCIQNINCNNTIISTGGSVIYKEESINHIKNILKADIIHLYIDYYEFMNRINNIQSRGIILNKNQSLKNLYDERIHLYNKYSDYTINMNNMGNDILSSILFK